MPNIFPTHLTTTSLELNLPKPEWAAARQTTTPAIWFAQKFPEHVNQFGCPFLEMRQSSCDGFSRINPVSINIDFFASMLGGDSGLGHSVVYFEPEMQFYYREPVQNLYKPTTPEKLQNYFRAMLLRCAQELNNDTDKLNLFNEFRSDKVAKAVVQRAKSILAADHTFFSPTSLHQRIRGPELHERLARVFVESMLEKRDGANLTVTQAHKLFLQLAQQRNLNPIPRITFKEMVRDLVQEKHGVCIRRDILNENKKQQEGWKGVVALTV